MQEFELWLDESGNFGEDEKNMHLCPSLIGGLLSEKGAVTSSVINQIIGSEAIHSFEEKTSEQFQRFKRISELDGKLVIFSNDERISILDSNLTYLNMMTEGLARLLEQMKAEYQTFYLHIVIACRCDTVNEDNGMIDYSEYKRRLEEKLTFNSLRGLDLNECWSIDVASARKEPRLMIADVICNTMLTRNTKFKKEEPEFSEYINAVYENTDRTIRFSVFEGTLDADFRNLLASDRIGEAAVVLCQSKKNDKIKKNIQLLEDVIRNRTVGEIELQYQFISSMVSYYIDGSREYEKCVTLLKNLLNYFIPVLQKKTGCQELTNRLCLDLYFYLMTVYSHLGNGKDALACEQKCEDLLKTLPGTWESVSYRTKYQNRKISLEINEFDFDKALQSCDQLVKSCRDLKDVLSLVYDGKDVHCIELAKALGTRAQIHMFQSRQEKSHYKDAVRDSEDAIREFDSDVDKCRQYLYRVQIETEGGNPESALYWLYRSQNVDPESGIIALLEKANTNPFALAQYIRLAAEGCYQSWEKGKEMMEKVSSMRILADEQMELRTRHPYEIMFWKYAFYEAWSGRMEKAKEYYKKAIQKCSQNAEEGDTLLVIRMAIELERYAMSLRNHFMEKESLKNLRKCMASLPESVIEKFGEELNLESKDWLYYFSLSRYVTY